MISLIAAIGKNNELGKNNNLVWSMPTDLKYFREKTSGHAVIMGRKTFEAIGRPMPNRRNIVITRDKNYKKESIEVVHSLEEAINSARTSPLPSPYKGEGEEIFIIGGEEIFKQSMNLAERLYITHIDAEDKKADTFFPEIIPIVWNEVSHEAHKKDKDNPYDYTFSVYERI
ncbi:dihydrofolate reductase [Candidatus Nomurabacteria bacterium RIFCSPHIGHO2_01_FULL_39_10]|uniref:Dihydrofolate reductase n=1 Tax=Candidatus Nomurabacteria bacterium RIFCSPHIGHO2_01_FULL_39_10 TaxID=1801733 RepID=A0A1F6V894_9BACT|nr:MAG: dihydrofolate reductase [Candidatus Nomurabacteria bacterium RIFCSPHIGHO2_01_FULL_39_10]